MTIKNEEDAFAAMKVLHDKGVEVVILSSSEICTQPGQLVTSFCAIMINLLPLESNGCKTTIMDVEKTHPFLIISWKISPFHTFSSFTKVF